MDLPQHSCRNPQPRRPSYPNIRPIIPRTLPTPIRIPILTDTQRRQILDFSNPETEHQNITASSSRSKDYLPEQLVSNVLERLDRIRAPFYEQIATGKAEDELIRRESEKRAQRVQDAQRNLARAHPWVHRFWAEDDSGKTRRP